MNTATSYDGSDSSDVSKKRTKRLLTVPNALCAIRLLGSPVLVVLAIADEPYWFLGLFFTLSLTDWLDGKLAVLLNQRSVVGPRLDSAADVAMYAGLMFGICWLKWEFLVAETVWMVAALATYAVSVAAGLVKFHRYPAYHTRAAKTCWLLVAVAVVSIFADWSAWPFRIAMIAVTAANIEATAITLTLRRRHADVPSIFHAWRLRSTP